MTAAIAIIAWQVLVINEIHYAPGDPDLEFVELHNRSQSPVALHGWTLEDASGTRADVAPRGITLPPGLEVVLARDGTRFSANWPGVPFLELSPWPSLNDGGDRLTLRGPDGEDIVSYAPSWGPPGRSLERIDPDGPSWHRVNWASCTDSRGATPGRRNSTYAPDRQPPELVAVDRAHRDTVVAWFSEPVLPATAAIDGTVRIPTDAEPGRVRWAFVVPAAERAVRLSVDGLSDLFGNTAMPLSAGIARAPSKGEVRISEVLQRPTVDPHDFLPDQVAFVELLSTASEAVTVRATRLGRRASETADADLAHPVPVPLVLQPGESAVVFDARVAGAEMRFAAAFPRAPTATAVPSASWPFARALGTVRLLASDGSTLDAVRLDDTWIDGFDGGRSLERYRFHHDGPAAWGASTDALGATPGRPNSLEAFADVRPASAGDIVVSEIHYAPSDGQPEFVEFFIRAREAVDANGLHARFGTGDSVRIAFDPSAWSPGAVFIASGSSTDPLVRHSALSASFALPGGLTVLPFRATLSNAGGEIAFRSGLSDSLDTVAWHDGLHHPGLTGTRGVSLERVDPFGPGTEGSNWRSSTDPSGATPGQTGFSTASGGEAGPLLSVPSVFHPEEDGERAGVRIGTSDGPGLVDVEVYDLTGRQVRTLAAGRIVHDSLSVYWDGTDDSGRPLPSAPYLVFARVTGSNGRLRAARKALVLARPRTARTEQPR